MAISRVPKMKQVQRGYEPKLPEEGPFPFERFRPATTAQRWLLAKYPILFRAARYPENYPSNLGYWGIECGPGWYPLLDKAACEIERELEQLIGPENRAQNLSWFDQKLREINDAWQASDMEMNIPGPLIPYCHTIEVSSGNLQIYLCSGELCPTATWQRILGITAYAKTAAEKTCERCGKAGSFRELYWERVLCDSCEQGHITQV